MRLSENATIYVRSALRLRDRRLWSVVYILLGVATAIICWDAVGWAFSPGVFLYMDEIGNLTRYLNGVQWGSTSLLPTAAYNDRPVGFILARVLFDAFKFDYYRQIRWFIVIHFANLILGFLLFKRLRMDTALALGAIACFGALSTTAQTATYIGAVFDVLGLFFILASILCFLSSFRGHTLLSTLLYVLAIRTKEFAIVVPALLFILALQNWPESAAQIRKALARVWPHLAAGAIFALRYASLLPGMMAAAGPGHPYHIDPRPFVVLQSFSYYTKLIFCVEGHSSMGWPVLLGALFLALMFSAVRFRSIPIAFALCGYVLTLLPVAILPGIRAPFYVYAPQMFLLLAVALALGCVVHRYLANYHGVTVVGIVILTFVSTMSLRRSAYFNDRVAFMRSVRSISARTANSVAPLIPVIRSRSRSHIAIYTNGEMPWLFVAGPCDYFRVLAPADDVQCQINPGRLPGEVSISTGSTDLILRYASDGSVQRE